MLPPSSCGTGRGYEHSQCFPFDRADKPKELGIPNSFPFKDQLLAEAQAEKARVSYSLRTQA